MMMDMDPSLVNLMWVSVCCGEQSDYPGLEEDDMHESLDLHVWHTHQTHCKEHEWGQREPDHLRDVKTVDFCAWEDAIRRRFPLVNVVVFAAFPNCGCFSKLSKGTNKRHIEKVRLSNGSQVYRPMVGRGGYQARLDARVIQHLVQQSGQVIKRHFHSHV